MEIQTQPKDRSDFLSLNGRLVSFYRFLNKEDWARCFEYIDPRLRNESKVQLDSYSQTMARFFAAYGPVQQIRIVKHEIYPGEGSRTDERDFAYIVISWKDKNNSYHHFRERWIRDQGRWYTRVVGLVADQERA